MDGVVVASSGRAAAPATSPGEEFDDHAPAGRKKRAQEMKVPLASAGGSPSTAVPSKGSPASVDATSATGSRPLARTAARSRATAPKVVSAQALSNDESDAESLAVVGPTSSRVGASTKRAATFPAAREKAAEGDSASESGESSDQEEAPRKPAEPARMAVHQPNAPAAARGRARPPDPTGSATAKRIARPQQSPQSSGAVASASATMASTAEGVERDAPAPEADAEDDEGTARLLEKADCAGAHGEQPRRRSVRSDRSAGEGKSSVSASSAGAESRSGDASQGPVGRARRPSGSAKASAKASAKSAAKAAQRVSFGNATTVSMPEFPAATAAKVNSDGGGGSPVNSAGRPAASRIEEESSDGEDSFDGRPAVAPPANPRAGGASSSSDDSTRRRETDEVDEWGEILALVDEWNAVEAQTNEFRERDTGDRGRINSNEDVLSTPITFGEAIAWVNALPLDVEALKTHAEEEVGFTQCGCFSRKRSASSIPGLSRRCQRSKDRVILLCFTDCDFNDLTHFRMLQTAYTKLTRNKVCPMVGRHWEFLGFQNMDPCTDLNVSGRLLNVLHFFFFFTHYFDIMKSAYLLAQDEVHNFPLACVCINLTQMVMECLLEGKLSRLCNASDKDVLDTTCKIFAGAMFYFYIRWKTLRRTICDIEAAIKEVRGVLEKTPVKLVQGLAKGVEALKQQASASKFEYTDLDFTGRAPGAGGAHHGRGVPRRLLNYAAQQQRPGTPRHT